MPRSERLSRSRLLIFSAPGVVYAAIELSWRIYLPSFFVTTLAFPFATVALLLLGLRIFSGLVDPIIGWASDRFPTRFGLRRHWLAIGAPMISIGAIGIFWATPSTSIVAIAVWSLLIQLGHRLTSTPHGGWALELSSDAHERVRIMGAKIWVGAVGGILVLMLPSLLERGLGFGRGVQVSALAGAIALLAPTTVLLVLRCIPEPCAPPRMQVVNPLALYLRMLRDPELRPIMILYSLLGISAATSAGTFLFFVEQALDLQGWGSTLILITAFIPLVALPLWVRVSHRFGKEQTLLLSYTWQALVTPLALLLPTGNLSAVAAWLVLSNLTLGVDYMLLRAMVSDIARREVDQGKRWAASRYALFNVTSRLAMGLGIATALGLLGWAGFDPTGPVSTEMQFVIRLVHVVPAGTAALIALLILSRNHRDRGTSTIDGIRCLPQPAPCADRRQPE